MAMGYLSYDGTTPRMLEENTMPKLFASDFDGTLHFHGESDRYLVRPADTQAILDFQAAGGLLASVPVVRSLP